MKDVQKDLTMLKIMKFSTDYTILMTYKNKLGKLESLLFKKTNELSEEYKNYLYLSKNILEYCKTCDRLLEIALIEDLNTANQKFQGLNPKLLKSMVESQLEDNPIALDRLNYILNSNTHDLEVRKELLGKIFQTVQANFAIWDLVRYCSGSKVDEKSIVSGLKQFKRENPESYYKIMQDLLYEDIIDQSKLMVIQGMVK